MGKEELLKLFLDNIYKEINPASFHAWFNDLEIINLTENKITFKVPMEIHKKMLASRQLVWASSPKVIREAFNFSHFWRLNHYDGLVAISTPNGIDM